jgi:hypothetical protein
VAGQQLAVLANISAQDFRYMATPIFVGALLVPLFLGSLVRLSAEAGERLRRRLHRRPAAPAPAGQPAGQPAEEPVEELEPLVASKAEPIGPETGPEAGSETGSEDDAPTEPIDMRRDPGGRA